MCLELVAHTGSVIWFFSSMDRSRPHRSAAARVENYSEFDVFGFDHLAHLKDHYLCGHRVESKDGCPKDMEGDKQDSCA